MPTFGGGHDLYVADNSDITFAASSNFCSSYQCPTSFVNANQYLAGLENNFLITEIEVYLAS
jgi:hypothetical protein